MSPIITRVSSSQGINSLSGFRRAFLGRSGVPAGYQIERSVRLNEADNAHFTRTPSSASNRKVFTFSAWLKRSGPGNENLQALFTAGSGASDNDYFQILFEGGTLRISALNYQARVSQSIYRDYSAWFHLLVHVDLNQASNSNKYRAWINNEEVSWTSTSSNQTNTGVNTTTAHYIGGALPPNRRSNCYLTEVHFVDGQALNPTDFGQFNSYGIWDPIEYTGTYGTNGFYLPFSDNSSASALGTDNSGNSNNWTVNNISVAAGAGNDSLLDSPTDGTQTDTGVGAEVSGNYCTLNPLVNDSVNTYTNGNLSCAFPGPTANATTFGTIAVSSGKWYWEGQRNDISQGLLVGIARIDANPASLIGSQAISYAYKETNGNKINNGTSTAYGTTGAHVGVALDLDAGTLTFYVNGVSQGVAFSGISGTFLPAWSEDSAGGGSGVDVNFGQRAFTYTAPSGFKALCTANLDTPTIADPSTVMDVVLWTGDNTASRAITGLNFSPDLLWIKSRSAGGWHALADSVRGAGKILSSNSTNSEYDNTDSNNAIQSFDSNGFTIGQQGGWVVNNSGVTQVAWSWDAGSSTVSNTDGTITSSVRANPSAGFSIVTWAGNSTAGATIGHGLNDAPSLILIKNRSITENWPVYVGKLGGTKALYLDLDLAEQTSSQFWNNTNASSSVFSVGSNTLTNNSGNNYVAYCFAPVEGYSSFTTYVGNSNVDGHFVWTGMRPRFIMIKCATAAREWVIFDSERSSYNESVYNLHANSSAAEASDLAIDILSNGFKIRTITGVINKDLATFVVAAFAENPFKTARAR